MATTRKRVKQATQAARTPVLKLLGKSVALPKSPADAVLERVPAPVSLHTVRLTCPEFTSLCPVTGQPDFAQIVVDYVPLDWLIESKAFKLFMGSFRNHASFHEAVACEIGERLWDAIEPQWIRVGAYFYPRGGIPIDVFFQDGALPKHAWIPDQGVSPYKAQR